MTKRGSSRALDSEGRPFIATEGTTADELFLELAGRECYLDLHRYLYVYGPGGINKPHADWQRRGAEWDAEFHPRRRTRPSLAEMN